MSRGYKVDIMAANLLEFEHHLRQFLVFTFLSSPFMGDWPVLTEDTSKVTVGEEDGTGPMLTHQWYFFTKMRMGAENDNLEWSPAEPSVTSFPIDPTTPGTEVTILKERVSLLNPLFKFTLSLQLFIGGHP
jgi:hypothetical protein